MQRMLSILLSTDTIDVLHFSRRVKETDSGNRSKIFVDLSSKTDDLNVISLTRSDSINSGVARTFWYAESQH